MANRDFVDGEVAALFASLPSASVVDRLTTAQTAFGSVNSVHDLIEHPQLQTRRMPVGTHEVEIPATPWGQEWDGASYPPVPALDQHGAALREEFAVQMSERVGVLQDS